MKSNDTTKNGYMLKTNKIWVIFSLIFWLICCQSLFLLVQRSSGEKTVESIQNQLRQELNFSDFQYLARSISDYTVADTIKCAVLEKTKPERMPIINLKYMENNCSSAAFLLNGSFFDLDLKTLNGDTYHLQFISNNTRFFHLALWGFRILGVTLIFAILFAISFKLQKDKLRHQLELEIANKVKDIAMQVSHDIRSPLTALKYAINDIHISDLQGKQIIINALERIEDIANNLLGKNLSKNEIILTEESLIPIIESIVFEKQIEFKNLKNISISLNIHDTKEIKNIKICQIEFKRLISNIINNARDALLDKSFGQIKIDINFTCDNMVFIEIRDNGNGISASNISKIGEKGFTVGKANSLHSGYGLGLNHAKKMIQYFGGKFEINSIEGSGTNVILSIPLSSQIINSIEKQENFEYVLIDDDSLVRMTWEIKARKKGITLQSFSSPKDFLTKKSSIPKSTFIYIDSELGLTKGEDMAQFLHLEGYLNISMTSGHPPEKFKDFTFLRSVISKAPPF